jgi:hypothetical protein
VGPSAQRAQGPPDQVADPHRPREKHQPEIGKASVSGEREPPFRSGHRRLAFKPIAAIRCALSCHLSRAPIRFGTEVHPIFPLVIAATRMLTVCYDFAAHLLDLAATLAAPKFNVAGRVHHFFAFSPISTRRRIASGRLRSGSFCRAIHVSSVASGSSNSRTPIKVPLPVVPTANHIRLVVD